MIWVILLLLALAILLVGAVAVLLLSRSDRNLSWLGAGSVVVAAVLGCIPAIEVLMRNSGGAIISLRSTPSPIPSHAPCAPGTPLSHL